VRKRKEKNIFFSGETEKEREREGGRNRGKRKVKR
jgi:hypothetical protein